MEQIHSLHHNGFLQLTLKVINIAPKHASKSYNGHPRSYFKQASYTANYQSSYLHCGKVIVCFTIILFLVFWDYFGGSEVQRKYI